MANLRTSSILALALAGSSLHGLAEETSCCVLTIRTAEPGSNTTVRIQNTSSKRVQLRLRAVPDTYHVSLRDTAGNEAPLTEEESSRQRVNRMFGGGHEEFRWLEPGDDVEQAFDLGSVREFKDGIYTLTLTRDVLVDGKRTNVSGRAMLRLQARDPAPGCEPQTISENARLGLDDRALAHSPIELRMAMDRTYVSRRSRAVRPEHAFVSALSSAKLSGGMVRSLNAPQAGAEVCIWGTWLRAGCSREVVFGIAQPSIGSESAGGQLGRFRRFGFA